MSNSTTDKLIWNPGNSIVLSFDECGSEYTFQFRLLDVGLVAVQLDIILEDSIQESLLLDSQADIEFVSRTTGETPDETIGFECHYSRDDIFRRLLFKFLPSANGVSEVNPLDFKKLKFVFSQYAFFRDENNLVGDIFDERKPNLLARSIETTGRVIRTSLRVTGEATAVAILAAGRTYTQYASGIPAIKETSEQEESDAKKHHATAEWIHSNTSNLAGAILYPARWTGRKAAEMSKGEQLDNLGPVKTAVVDTVAGLGNAVASVTKGITEYMGAVGGAIGETALSHSRAKYGEEYTNRVTEHYVKAGEEIGKSGYKAAALATNGVSGVVLTAMIEGVDMNVNLYDYLVGPVILHGYVRMVQLPFKTPVNYFAVLRPWSISFYLNESDFTSKPNKILITSLLDTLPKIRNRDDISTVYASIPAEEDLIESEFKQQQQDDGDGVEMINFGNHHPHNNTTASAAAIDKNNENNQSEIKIQKNNEEDNNNNKDNINNNGSNENENENACKHSISEEIAIDDRNGPPPTERFIELCTVDCSTFLLWPEDNVLNQWFEELQLACRRVETIAKRKSGALEISEMRRAKSLKKDTVIHMRLLKIVLKAAFEEDREEHEHDHDHDDIGDVVFSTTMGAEGSGGVSGSISKENSPVRVQVVENSTEGKNANSSDLLIIEEKDLVIASKDNNNNNDSCNNSIPTVTATATATVNPRVVKAVLLSAAAPTVIPTIKKSVHETSVWLKDVTRVLVLHSYKFKPERQSFSPASLHNCKDNLSSDLVASVESTGQFLEFGHKLCVSNKTCRGFILKLRSEVTYGGEMVLGIGEFSLLDVPPVGESEVEIWVPMSGGAMGSVFVQLSLSRKNVGGLLDTE
eukprot:gene4397-8752_t